MTTIIITAIIGIIAIALTDTMVDVYNVHFIPAILKKKEMERKAALAMAESACHCRTCLKRKEREMVLDMVTNTEAFYAEIARSNGANSMQMIMARAMVAEINK